MTCEDCDENCATCSSAGASPRYSGCVCRNRYDQVKEMCTSGPCSAKTFFVPKNRTGMSYGVCQKCHEHCAECKGANVTQCTVCTPKRFLCCGVESVHEMGTCVDSCPESWFASHHDGNAVCVDKDPNKGSRRLKTAIGSTVASLFLIVVIAAFVVRKYQRKAANADKDPYDIELDEPNPDARPNMSVLQLIHETDLEKDDKMIGSGAFGSVYRGFLLSCSPKRPVAIKILKDTNPEAQHALLEEGAHMASLKHRFLIPFLGICVGNRLMIVTSLMPLGNLLNYVQDHKEKIGSHALLRWFVQIAEGMSYLESHHMVHRDLAARNILVQTYFHIRITDFGLSKALDYGEEEYIAWNDKVAFKWLALECIRQRVFTHKSDVWAYGVTLWELMTFGESPYRGKMPYEIPILLEKGERLRQPKVCTLDVYMVLIKCWMIDGDSRPSFTELADIFKKMCRDPPRYVHIPDDKYMRTPSSVEDPVPDEYHYNDETIDPDEYFGSIPPSSCEPETPHSARTFKFPAPVATARRQESVLSQRYAKEPFASNKAKEEVSPLLPTMDQDNYLIPNAHESSLPSSAQTSSLRHSQSEGDRLYYNKLSDDPPARKTTLPGIDNIEYLGQSIAGNTADSTNIEYLGQCVARNTAESTL